ncbi:DNA sulfur modification protein DndB [Nonomuraea sp. NPDC047897]|uniref:DNA sulfur modification protein DndB n=1 Tax=Nonomuraea sp. NPDC047897 TaxID=3364346 RepID=UPI0037173D30
MITRGILQPAHTQGEGWKPRLAPSRKLDWSRTDPDWEGHAIVGGRVSKNHQNVVLTVNPLRMQGADPIRQDQSAPCYPATCNDHEVIPS